MDKSTLTSLLSNTCSVLEKTDICDAQVAAVSDLSGRLKGKQIVISVFGQFKRGKSTLINSILKEQILPVGIIPVTSVVTRIEYGEIAARVHFEENQNYVDIEEINQFVNEKHNPNNTKKVKSVSLWYPSEFLKNGIVLVDTPGVGSIHMHNTDAAYSCIKESDAVIFLLSVDSPVNQIESEFLSSIKKHIQKIYFAVNKVDLLSENELNEYLEYSKDVISQLTELDTIRLFPISAKEDRVYGVNYLIDSIINEINSCGERILCDSIRRKLIPDFRRYGTQKL